MNRASLAALLTAAVHLGSPGGVASVHGAQQPETVRLSVRVTGEGAPVEGAEVRARATAPVEEPDPELEEPLGITSLEGIAVLRLAPDPYRITVSRLGFEDAERRITLRAGADTMIAVQLETEAIEIEDVIVTATRSERPIEEEPVRVEALPREEIDENVALAPGNLTMVLTDLGGVRIQTTAQTLGGAQVRLLGLRGRYTQLLTDGLPLYGGQLGAFSVTQIPPIDLAQVEVIKGTASALYGGAAVGGVINLVSRRPSGTPEALISQTTKEGTDAVVFIPHRLSGRWGYTLLASAHDQGEVDVDDDGWVDVAGYRRYVVRPRIFWDGGEGRSLFLTLGGTLDEREGGSAGGATLPEGSRYREARDTRRGDAGLVGRFLFEGGALLSLRAAAMAEEHDHVYGVDAYDDLQSTWFAEATLSGDAGDHLWVVGAAYQENRLRSDDLPQFDYTYRVPALFAQDVYEPRPWLTLSASARADFHDPEGTFVNPRLSVLFRPAEGWAIRAAAGLGYAAPTPLVERVQEIGLSRLLPPGELEPERARSASLDVEREIGALELSASVFGTEIDDALLVRDSESEAGRVDLINAPTPTRALGFELRAVYLLGPVYVLVSHAHLHSREASPVGGRRDTPLTPRNVFMVDAVVEPDEETRVGIEGAWIGHQPLDEDDPYRDRSRPYVILGLLAERQFGRLGVFFNVDNILDARQTRWTPLLRPERANDGRWTTDVWAPLEGREVNAGLRYRF